MTAGRDSRQIRLLLLAPDATLPGGVGEFVRSQLGHLSDATHTRVFTVGRRYSDASTALAALRPLADTARLVRLLRREPVDLMHINPSFGLQSLMRDGLFMLVTASMPLGGVVVFFHGWDDALAERIRRIPPLRLLFRLAYGRAAHIYVLADSFKRQLVELGIEPAVVEVTTTMFDARQMEAVPRPLVKPPRDRIRLLYLGRVVAAKGLHELLDAYAELAASHASVDLVIAGDGPEREGLMAKVRDRHLDERVAFTGFVSGTVKTRLFQDADIFVLPSYREGCPVAVLEAMAMGLPIIASRKGGIPAVVQDGVNGLLLERVDVASIRHALDFLILDEGARLRMGEQNRKKAWQHYEAGVVTRGIEAQYRRLLRLGPKGVSA